MNAQTPGAPGAEPPDPHDSGRTLHKPDQRGPAGVGPTGEETLDNVERSQMGTFLTTAQGARLKDTDHSLKAGERGPTLLQDHHLREKITHFDHERIPERVVHARGAAAHGYFESYGNAATLTRAKFLAEKRTTPVFTRFSTVVGSRGSSDAVRDTRGFATKFYTDEGTFDLVGNNIPVFFIQDGIKFPDIVHAAKPHPDREIPQAQSAHDTFWDFVSLHTEAQAHAMWQMSDRGIPRSYRMMEGFGVHTFRLVNSDGDSSLVKFHWKPLLGVHSLMWEEAQMINGADPDFHRRDLADAIEAGAYPQWELGVQVFPDNDEQVFQGIDLLDPTKFVPEELAPVQAVGQLTLDANPKNYFEETEQVAFHPGHLVPGIEVTSDPLLQARLFSYIDTQISRLGGPNFSQIPINRPHADVNDMLRDGMHQSANHTGVAPYRPNSLDGGCPFVASENDAALLDFPEEIKEAITLRESPASFDDHFSQATLFYRSLTPVEQHHVAQGYAFELGKCYEPLIRARQVEALANIDENLCREVAQELGLAQPAPQIAPGEPEQSSALPQVGRKWPVDGRNIGVIVDAGSPMDQVEELIESIGEHGMVPVVVASAGGELENGSAIQRTYLTARSVEFDALVFLTNSPSARTPATFDAKAGDPTGRGETDPRLVLLAAEAYRHAKPIVVGGSTGVLTAAGIPDRAPGVVIGAGTDAIGELVGLVSEHRVWGRVSAGEA